MICLCGETFTPPPRRSGSPRKWCERCRQSWSRKLRVLAGTAVPVGLAPRCACGRRMRLSRNGQYADRCGRCRANTTRPREPKKSALFVPLPPIDWSKVRRVIDARTTRPTP